MWLCASLPYAQFVLVGLMLITTLVKEYVKVSRVASMMAMSYQVYNIFSIPRIYR